MFVEQHGCGSNAQAGEIPGMMPALPPPPDLICCDAQPPSTDSPALSDPPPDKVRDSCGISIGSFFIAQEAKLNCIFRTVTGSASRLFYSDRCKDSSKAGMLTINGADRTDSLVYFFDPCLHMPLREGGRFAVIQCSLWNENAMFLTSMHIDI